MAEATSIPWTFDAFLEADLERVYQQGKDEVLRDRAFRILLAHAGSVDDLERFAFGGERKAAGWTTNELLEISNSFRLMSSPENEIRLYRECGNEDFRNAQRVREFYVLALTKAGRPAEAIREGAALIAQGGQNALVWGALAQSHMARVQFAEHLLGEIGDAGGSLCIDGPLALQFETYFPEVQSDELSAPQVRMLREQSLAAAARIFRQGFVESGNPYPGLGWMLCTLDQLCDGVAARKALQQENEEWLDQGDRIQMEIFEAKIARLKRLLASQGRLLTVSLALQGGDESQDYWTHAGYLRLTILQRARLDEFDALLACTIACGDAAFKHAIVIGELQRIRRQFQFLIDSGALGNDEAESLALQAQYAEIAIAELESARMTLAMHGKPPESTRAGEASATALARFIEQTINFHALIGNLLPVFIQGTIGRVGARVPDLLINGQVQQDLSDLIENAILPALPLQERADPLAVIHRIHETVGQNLNIGALQDLQSPSHEAFDIRSDGMITLSGVDYDLRKDTVTSTMLTASMLMQNCDCRETMYLNGALFASWQQSRVKQALARAVQCLDLDHDTGFENILSRHIPALLRYQLRAGQVNVYVEGIAMQARYKVVRNAGDRLPLERDYTLASWRAGQPLTSYELENSILAVTHADGTQAWIEPKDAQTGAWQPLAHRAVADGSDGAGGVPVIPNAGEPLRALALLNQVESHAMTFLLDTQTGRVELCDGFYNERLFDSPYRFSAGAIDLNGLLTSAGLIRAGSRAVRTATGEAQQRAVQLQFTHYSQARYATGLIAGDTPNSLQFMGRTYHTDFKRERHRLVQGNSPIPALLEKIHDWQLQRSQAAGQQRNTLERRLTWLMLEMAREHPEQVEMLEVRRAERLISEDTPNAHVYLVLSGSLSILRNGLPLYDAAGLPITVSAGGLVGEISALRGSTATASVQGDALVLAMTQEEIKAQIHKRPHLLASLEDLMNYRLDDLARNGARPV